MAKAWLPKYQILKFLMSSAKADIDCSDNALPEGLSPLGTKTKLLSVNPRGGKLIAT